MPLATRTSDALVSDGWADVVCLSRDPARTSVPRGVNAAGWEALPSLVDGASCVVNLAGANPGAQRWTEGVKREILQSRLEAIERVGGAIGGAARKPRALLQALLT